MSKQVSRSAAVRAKRLRELEDIAAEISQCKNLVLPCPYCRRALAEAEEIRRKLDTAEAS